MVLAIGTDHRGFALKEKIKKYLQDKKYNVIDFGTDSTASVDYPDFAVKVGKSVSGKESDFGIAICGSGIGICIAVDKVKGIRAVNVNSDVLAEMSRRHNNANVICLGSDFVDFENAIKYIEIFLHTDFEGGERHERRTNKIDNI
jgi:ribose 5-phosphate isomerase B